jgi:hypothetical protein
LRFMAAMKPPCMEVFISMALSRATIAPDSQIICSPGASKPIWTIVKSGFSRSWNCMCVSPLRSREGHP